MGTSWLDIVGDVMGCLLILLICAGLLAVLGFWDETK